MIAKLHPLWQKVTSQVEILRPIRYHEGSPYPLEVNWTISSSWQHA